jgi:mono/diheme cytochrome c family protein
MPQYSDLTETEMHDISRWIHFARMRGRSDEIMKVSELSRGDAVAGKSRYEKSCNGCHSTQAMTAITHGIKPVDLKATLLKPAILTAVASYKVGVYNDSKRLAAIAAHSTFTENSSPQAVSDLLAYLKTMK